MSDTTQEPSFCHTRAASDAARLEDCDSVPPTRILTAEVMCAAVILGFDPRELTEIHIDSEGVTVVEFERDADGKRVLAGDNPDLPLGYRKVAYRLGKLGPQATDDQIAVADQLRATLEDAAQDAAATLRQRLTDLDEKGGAA